MLLVFEANMKKKIWIGLMVAVWVVLLVVILGILGGGTAWKKLNSRASKEVVCPADSLPNMMAGDSLQPSSADSTSRGKTLHSVESEGFVMLSEVAPEILQEIRYYSSYNFVGTRIDGYEEPVALLTREAAIALKAVNDDLMQQGYRLKVYDAYRPMRAVRHFRRWAADLNDTLMKADFYPNLPKSVLFHKGYISSRSGHARGSTVDLTIVDLVTGQDVDMGGTFDLLDPQSHPLRHDYVTEQQFQNRMILRNAMTRHGFKAIGTEWWHFTLRNEPYPDTYFDFPVKSL